MKRTRNLLMLTGIILGAVISIFDLVEGVRVLNQVSGYWGVLVGVAILPATLAATPIYLLVVQGQWLPIVSVYGGGAISAYLIKANSKSPRRKHKR